MSVRVMTLVFDAPIPSVEAKMIALKLADCANDDGDNIFPSRATVERTTGCGASTVKKYLRLLEDCGLLQVVNRGGGFKRDTTHRCFDMDKLRALVSGDLVMEWVATDAGKVLQLRPATAEIEPSEGAASRPPHSPRGPCGDPEGAAGRPPGGRVAAPNHQGTIKEPSPPTPQSPAGKLATGEGAPAAGSKWESVFEQVIAESGEDGRRVVDCFLRPVTAEIAVRHERPAELFAAIVREVGHEPEAVLRAAAREIVRSRSVLIAPKNAIDAAALARQTVKAGARATVEVSREHDGDAFAAWVAWAEANVAADDRDARRRAQFIRKMVDEVGAGSFLVPSRLPPAVADAAPKPAATEEVLP